MSSLNFSKLLWLLLYPILSIVLMEHKTQAKLLYSGSEHTEMGYDSPYINGSYTYGNEIDHGLPVGLPGENSMECHGVCVHPTVCVELKGTMNGLCSKNHLVCCTFSTNCNHVTKEVVSFFNNPGYPEPAMGTMICQHDVHIQPGICGLRLEFQQFNTRPPLDRGLCDIDQFLILNSLDGPTFGRCGQLTGYAVIVAVDPHQMMPVTLLSIIQANEQVTMWNVKITQIKCDMTRRPLNYPHCGMAVGHNGKYSHEKWTRMSKSRIPRETGGISKRMFHSKGLSTDNAFYVEYLKQAHTTMYQDPSSNPKFCRNTARDIQNERKNNFWQYTNSILGKKMAKASSRIIRGDDAHLYEFPWQVSIQNMMGHFCGGAIISEYFVLSAAHCFLGTAPISLNEVRIVVGDFNLNTTRETNHVAVGLHSVVFHSHFDPYYLRNDIAVIRLSQPIHFRPGIQPICLAQPGETYARQLATVSGWGAINFPMGELASTLQQLETTIIDNYECHKLLNIEHIYSTTLCAVAPPCSGTCFGDSGGPLVIRDHEVSYLVGIVSFGIGGCALLPYWPDVYTRVTEYLDWLYYATTWGQ